MSAFQIEDNVPIPATTGKLQRKYPLSALLVGQSFFVPFTSDDTRKQLVMVSGAATRHGRKFGKLFITRTVEGDVRVWRVE
jgi:hypothetical protein